MISFFRKSSVASQASKMAPGSFYDPISTGTSRRSSQLSTTTTGGTGVPPAPPSHLLAGHLQKLQNSPNTNSNLVLQVHEHIFIWSLCSHLINILLQFRSESNINPWAKCMQQYKIFLVLEIYWEFEQCGSGYLISNDNDKHGSF